MNLSEIKQLLAEGNLKLTKSLGQNFLHDGNQLDRIVELGKLTASDCVLEIGPGLGPLTERLLPNCGQLLAIEKDGRLVEILENRFSSEATLSLIHADALKWLSQNPDRDWRSWKLVANLPYSVASPILVELALSAQGPEAMVATLQLEVVQRIRARPKSKEYGVLTLLIQLHYQPGPYFKVPASCFYPQPDVASGCLRLVRRQAGLLRQEEVALFVRLVKVGFGQRRKVMLKLLKSVCPLEVLEAVYARIGLDSRVRAEAVSLEEFVELTRGIAAAKRRMVDGRDF